MPEPVDEHNHDGKTVQGHHECAAVDHAHQSEEEDDNNDTTPFPPLVDTVITTEVFPLQPERNIQQSEYNPKKPKWWKHLSGRATKAQKRAVRNVLDDRGLRLKEVPYGSQLDWDAVFSKSPEKESETSSNNKPYTRNIWLELGFGRGENLLAMAHRHRHDKTFCLVGAEIHNPGIGIVCTRIQDAWRENDDSNSRYWTDYTTYAPNVYPNCSSNPSIVTALNSCATDNRKSNEEKTKVPTDASATPSYSNLRISPGDGVKLLPKIPSDSLDAILVTFPDPFSKPEEVQWRLLQVQTLSQFYRILRKVTCSDDNFPPRSGRFYLATDHRGYFTWAHKVMEQINNDMRDEPRFRLVEPCPDRMEWLPAISTYEQKGWDEGRSTNLACWEVI
jgi:tRNA G46 methylase TrmB